MRTLINRLRRKLQAFRDRRAMADVRAIVAGRDAGERFGRDVEGWLPDLAAHTDLIDPDRELPASRKGTR